jgi:hypothetical protein
VNGISLCVRPTDKVINSKENRIKTSQRQQNALKSITYKKGKSLRLKACIFCGYYAHFVAVSLYLIKQNARDTFN